MPMLQSLYEFYKQSPISLYKVRKHYLEHFYYKNHDKKEARSVLNMIVDSSKLNDLIKRSLRRKKAPVCEDYITIVINMVKLVLKSHETQVLAVMDAALKWDIEVNEALHLKTSEELKNDIIRAFKVYEIFKDVTEEDTLSASTDSSEEKEKLEMEEKDNITEEPEERLSFKKQPRLKTWSLMAFTKEFGELKVAPFKNKKTGDIFISCVCMKGWKRTYVGFSSKLGELTPEEIEEMKDELVVVQLPSGRYSLAKPKLGMWKDVNI